jgi:hypothetical protein
MSAADRVREYRARKKTGAIMITVAVDEASLVAALIDANLLDANCADDHAAITEATQRMVKLFSGE